MDKIMLEVLFELIWRDRCFGSDTYDNIDWTEYSEDINNLEFKKLIYYIHTKTKTI